MVFSSIPVYLDPPNWQQQPNPQPAGGGGGSEAPQLSPPVPPPSLVGGGGTNSIRPGSMADRAWLGKLPPPEATLKCPRCESTNTKFCYFNNYNLSQPRHFCKTCRRYWTRGGALRNVPVGGGFRRNKKSKRRSRSKSPVTSTCPNSSTTTDIITHLPLPLQQLPFLPSLHSLHDFGGTGGDIGFNFAGVQPSVSTTGGADMEIQMGGAPRFADQWRLEQFPFLAGLEQPPHGAFQFEGISEGVEPFNYIGGATGQLGSKPLGSQMATVKVEQNQGVNLSRNFLGIQGSDHLYWGGNAWTDLSGFATSSSTSHLL